MEKHCLLLFDGRQWREIGLPEEILNIGDTRVLSFLALTSDRILFMCYDAEERYENRKLMLYQVLLSEDTLALEYAGAMK